ncbi:MAG TPA: hypothetical protein DEA47_05935 [Peptococcaceae bacterium]|nr:MAG: hypothetical protein XD50_0906 [Clostridia bacterium 41_269]HBT20882.1 hypothetical protein [Peptococcaceae bacterium]
MEVKFFYLCWLFLIAAGFVFIVFETRKLNLDTKGIVLVMVRNCEEAVEAVLRILCFHCWKRDQGSILVIIEDSYDKTGDIVARLSQKHSEINVVFRGKELFNLQHVKYFLDRRRFLLDLRNFA